MHPATVRGIKMKRITDSKPFHFVLHSIALLLLIGAPAVLAQETAEEAVPAEEQTTTGEAVQEMSVILETPLDAVVVTGSRAQPRSLTESAVPIDVIQVEEFVQQGGSDLADLMRNVVPSYNVNTQPISDAGTIVRPLRSKGWKSCETAPRRSTVPKPSRGC